MLLLPRSDWPLVWPTHTLECLLARTEKVMSSSQDTWVFEPKNQKAWSHFWPKVGGKNWNYLFYPSAKSRRELKIKTLGVTFRGASAYYVQKSIAPQKQAVCRFSDGKKIDENFYRKFSPIFLFRLRKMKCRESSETRFPKVWGRTEPSSGGKPPFKVSHFSKMRNFERTFTPWN